MSRVDKLKKIHGWLTDKFTGHRVVFHHIPKCGGTSVARALRMKYLLSQTTIHPIFSNAAISDFFKLSANSEAIDRTLIFRQQMLLYYLHYDVRCIAAHVPFSEVAYDKFCDKYKFITILRDPVERFISHYFHSYKRNDYSRIDLSLEQYVETEDAKNLGASYVKFLSSVHIPTKKNNSLIIDEAINSASENLNKFDCIGYVGDMNNLSSQISTLLDIKINIGHENRGNGNTESYRKKLTPDLINKIEDVCSPDISIFNSARDKLELIT